MRKAKLKNNNIRMSVDLAEAMKNVAKTRRVQVGVIWEDAARVYLASLPADKREATA